MGSGDPSGLQNRRELASLALVSSTLTRFRHSAFQNSSGGHTCGAKSLSTQSMPIPSTPEASNNQSRWHSRLGCDLSAFCRRRDSRQISANSALIHRSLARLGTLGGKL